MGMPLVKDDCNNPIETLPFLCKVLTVIYPTTLLYKLELPTFSVLRKEVVQNAYLTFFLCSAE